MLGIIGVLLLQAAPLWLFLALVTMLARRQLKRRAPDIAAFRAWKQRRLEIEAEMAEVSYRRDNVDEMLAVRGRLEAHDVLKPRLPAWMFWIN